MSTSQKFLNKLIAMLLIIPLLIPVLPNRTTYADDKIIYLGGSASGGSGVVGNWTISMPGKATALKVTQIYFRLIFINSYTSKTDVITIFQSKS